MNLALVTKEADTISLARTLKQILESRRELKIYLEDVQLNCVEQLETFDIAKKLSDFHFQNYKKLRAGLGTLCDFHSFQRLHETGRWRADRRFLRLFPFQLKLFKLPMW